MISIEKRREVFIQYFLNFESQRKICSDLNLSKGSVTKIIKQYRERIFDLNLTKEENLSNHIDMIVVEQKRKKRQYKRLFVTEIHIAIIKSLVISNEKNRTLKGKSGSISLRKLYEKFIENLEEYSDAADSLKTCRDKTNMESENKANMDKNKNKYENYYKKYVEICLKNGILIDLNNLNYELYYLSLQTFYKLVKEIKREIGQKVVITTEIQPEEQLDEDYNKPEFEKWLDLVVKAGKRKP